MRKLKMNNKIWKKKMKKLIKKLKMKKKIWKMKMKKLIKKMKMNKLIKKLKMRKKIWRMKMNKLIKKLKMSKRIKILKLIIKPKMKNKRFWNRKQAPKQKKKPRKVARINFGEKSGERIEKNSRNIIKGKTSQSAAKTKLLKIQNLLTAKIQNLIATIQ